MPRTNTLLESTSQVSASTGQVRAVACQDPEELEETLNPLVTVSVNPIESSFYAEVALACLPRTSFFSPCVPKARVQTEDAKDHVGLSFVVAGGFTDNHQHATYAPGTGLLLNSSLPMDVTTEDSTHVMVCNFYRPLVETYATKYCGDEQRLPAEPARVSVETRAGAFFWRYLSFIWSELEGTGAFLRSPAATAELEESLLAMLLSAWLLDVDKERDAAPCCLQRAEDYIDARLSDPLLVADIAAAAGTSVSTLNRAFRKRHGIGPKSFLRKRRLEALQRELLAASPLETTVTELAMRYGLFQLGHFARDYRTAFGELPSQTLRRHSSMAAPRCGVRRPRGSM